MYKIKLYEKNNKSLMYSLKLIYLKFGITVVFNALKTDPENPASKSTKLF